MAIKKKLIENFTSLSVLQASKYVLPMITFPYLVRVIGPEKFGLISFAQAFVMYFMILTDYGFNLSATRRVAIHREDRQKLSEIFSAVLVIELGLILLSLVLLMSVVFGFERFRQDWLLYLWTFGIVPGNVFSLIWFFQGMEKMKFITALNLFSKTIFLVSIFIWVRQPSDYLNAAILYTLGYFASGAIGLWLAVKRFKVGVIWPGWTAINTELVEGYHVFIASISASIYTSSSVFILGLMSSNTIVGYYSAGEKIVKAVQALFNPVSQSIFPHLSQLAQKSKSEALAFARKATLMSGWFLFLVSCLIFFFAPQIVAVALGGKYLSAVPVIRILSALPFIANMGNIFGTQILINFDYARVASRVAIVSSLLNIPLVIGLVYLYQANGAAGAMIITEVFVAVAYLYLIERKGLSLRRPERLSG
ncbi:MAG: flippase [Candidatus Margulisbacteria bacterium]|nr:flippase [Candidatus Margulisiibacteriota bacterium]